jgi:hypothetical protein
MICTFCGADNRPENKFCGMCGVRLEQRKAERRLRQDPTSLKCHSCGHINEPGYKFCGMCGSRIERRISERRGSGVGHSRATAVANAGLPTPEGAAQRRSSPPPSRSSATEVLPEPEPEPPTFFRSDHGDRGIPGPSFLGLSDEPESEGGYLLEDEGKSRRGLRTLVLLAILAAIVGLIVMQWRSGFKLGPKAPEAPKTEPAQKPQGAAPPAPASSGAPATDDLSNSSDKSSGVTSQAAVEQGFSDNGKQILDKAFGNEKGTGTAAAKEDGAEPSAAKPAKPDSTDAGQAADAPSDGVAAADERATANAREKPSPDATARVPPKPSKLLVKAQQYLQGTGGVRRNCEQGLIYLRAAAQKNDPEAAVQMAALYSSGHCVQRDRVMAWRWFTSALELEPENHMIKANMDQLWAGMTAQERRQASR